ncbi:hypothetical protein PFTANZ_05259 [Plasmodium falciparum Tanzania (2000708)]|uniref:Serine/threonine-protein phosphatase 2A activator n=1 Tax=Plasmodium falciparum Tanzania (2000708) TaxID=1036725 RepID=A0A024VZI1_PLAFA|nr:hypothetical protein PFTANZ_05259 [Plasmodium falciparum Tanzania (2000708)]
MGDVNSLSYKIINDESIIRFTKSSIYNDIIEFITNLNKSVVGVEMKPLEDFKLCNENDMINNDNFLFLSKNVYNIFQLIKNMNKCIDSCPPINQSSRFGNRGFQHFCDAYYKEVDEYLPHALSESNIPNISEHTYQISYYLKNSIGNKKRIDYGTGHELNFLLFLFCLNKINFFIPSDYKHLVLVLYRQYIEKKELLELWAPKYLYFDALKYISMIKHAPFHESSQMLYDISGVETWEKICNGLLKMYQAEIIQKRQILQHILFGNLIDF